MGQKSKANQLPPQVHKNWSSRWFAGKRDFAKWLAGRHQDFVTWLKEVRFSPNHRESRD